MTTLLPNWTLASCLVCCNTWLFLNYNIWIKISDLYSRWVSLLWGLNIGTLGKYTKKNLENALSCQWIKDKGNWLKLQNKPCCIHDLHCKYYTYKFSASNVFTEYRGEFGSFCWTSRLVFVETSLEWINFLSNDSSSFVVPRKTKHTLSRT